VRAAPDGSAGNLARAWAAAACCRVDDEPVRYPVTAPNWIREGSGPRRAGVAQW
jgi:hypothetical protein